MKTDPEIQADVMKELKWDTSITSEHIGVAVSNRVVTFTGRVPSDTEKWAAEKAVQRVADVKAIADELEVNFPARLNAMTWQLLRRPQMHSNGT